MVEAGHALVERLLEIEPEFFRRCLELVEIGQIALVGLPEIERVGQARAHHLAVAVRDLLAAILRLDIGGEDEAVGEVLADHLAGASRSISGWRGWSAGSPRRGMARKSCSNSPISTTGHSTSPDTSSSKPFVLDQVEPVGEGEIAGVGKDDLLAPVGIEHDLGRFQLGHIVVEAAHGDFAGRDGSDGRR